MRKERSGECVNGLREKVKRERAEVKGLRKERSGECVNSLREKMKRERKSRERINVSVVKSEKDG